CHITYVDTIGDESNIVIDCRKRLVIPPWHWNCNRTGCILDTHGRKICGDIDVCGMYLNYVGGVMELHLCLDGVKRVAVTVYGIIDDKFPEGSPARHKIFYGSRARRHFIPGERDNIVGRPGIREALVNGCGHPRAETDYSIRAYINVSEIIPEKIKGESKWYRPLL